MDAAVFSFTKIDNKFAFFDTDRSGMVFLPAENNLWCSFDKQCV